MRTTFEQDQAARDASYAEHVARQEKNAQAWANYYRDCEILKCREQAQAIERRMGATIKAQNTAIEILKADLEEARAHTSKSIRRARGEAELASKKIEAVERKADAAIVKATVTEAVKKSERKIIGKRKLLHRDASNRVDYVDEQPIFEDAP